MLRAVSLRLFGSVVPAEHIPSDEADVYRLRPGCDGASRIVKIEREGGRVVSREQRAFPALRARGLVEFPEVELTDADIEDAGVRLMVMPETAGVPFSELWERDRAGAFWVAERIGDFLRRLGDVPWDEVPGVVTPHGRAQYVEWFGRFLDPLWRHAVVAECGEPALLREAVLSFEQPLTSFGGWQFAQCVTDGRHTFTTIDWGNIGAFWPMNDLAAATFSMDRFGPGAREELEPVLFDAFGLGRVLDRSARTQLDAWLIVWHLFGAAAALEADREADAREHLASAAHLVRPRD